MAKKKINLTTVLLVGLGGYLVWNGIQQAKYNTMLTSYAQSPAGWAQSLLGSFLQNPALLTRIKGFSNAEEN